MDIENKKVRNFNLALASCTLLIECIDNTIENLAFETKYKVLARKFQRECEKITNRMFRACLNKDELAAYEGNEINVKLIKYIFESIPVMENEEIEDMIEILKMKKSS